MKNLHKKIGAIALAGMVVAGGILSSGVRIYADASVSSNKHISPEDQRKYNKNQYPVLNVDLKYIYSLEDVVVQGSNRDIEKLEDALKGSGFVGIKYSGEVDVIDDFLEGLNIKQLEKPQVCFLSIDSFKRYIEDMKNGEVNIDEGIYRFMIDGFDGVFRFRKDRIEIK